MNSFEVLWYVKGLNDAQFRVFSTRQSALNFYNKHKDNDNYYDWWVTKRNTQGEVIEDIIY